MSQRQCILDCLIRHTDVCFSSGVAQDASLVDRVEELERRVSELENAGAWWCRKCLAKNRPATAGGSRNASWKSTRSTDTTEAAGASDADADGLTDAEEVILGTAKNNPDTDGDALDGWEVHGVNGIDLIAMGASPLRKDIFIRGNGLHETCFGHARSGSQRRGA
ncbi:MAG: hypothetical protein U0936_18545 [Planctomycetaceae bacterium]